MYSKENISIHNLKSHRELFAELFSQSALDQNSKEILKKRGYISWKKIKKLTDSSLVQLGIVDRGQRSLILGMIDQYLKSNFASATSLKNVDMWSENSLRVKSKAILCKAVLGSSGNLSEIRKGAGLLQERANWTQAARVVQPPKDFQERWRQIVSQENQQLVHCEKFSLADSIQSPRQPKSVLPQKPVAPRNQICQSEVDRKSWPIWTVGDAFLTRPRLVTLNLTDNQISRIEGLQKLVLLKRLFLSKNKIKKIENLESLMSLEELHVDHQRPDSTDNGPVLELTTKCFVNNPRLRIFEGNGNQYTDFLPLSEYSLWCW